MRFGAALDLWHKGDLHGDDGDDSKKPEPKADGVDAEAAEKAVAYLDEADSLDDLKARWGRIPKPVQAIADVIAAKDAAKDRLSKPANDDLDVDDIPY